MRSLASLSNSERPGAVAAVDYRPTQGELGDPIGPPEQCPAAMARVRNFAISALRLGGHDNIARATRYYSRHLDKVAELLAPKAA